MDESVWGPSGVHTFRIRGELVHRCGSLLPSEQDIPKFAQIYILDSNRQAHLRNYHNHNRLHLPTLLHLQDMFQQLNPYIHMFFTARERLANNEHVAIRIKTLTDPNLDHRRYNQPTADEVAAIIPDSSLEAARSRELILHSRGGPLTRVSELSSAYAPLRYPIIFPRGEQGWHPELSLP